MMMAHRVSTSQLPELADWLELFLPDSCGTYGLAISCIRGLEEDEFWTDSWPNITSVIVTLPKNSTNQTRDKYNSITVFSTDEQRCRRLLMVPGIVDWKDSFLFRSVPLSVKNCIDAVCRERGVTTRFTHCCIMKFAGSDTNTAKVESTVPNGFTLEPLKVDDAGLIISRWKFADQLSKEYIPHFIRTYPSAGIRNPAGCLVGWVLVNRDWVPGLLHVEPAYRRRGFGTALLCHLTRAIVGEGVVPFSMIEADNEASIEFHKKCGYITTRASDSYFIPSLPEKLRLH